MQKVKWGIIGCGDVTEVKSGPAFNKVENSELIAVMRRNSQKAKDYAERHKVPKWYSNADDLINDPDVNAVYIATPPGSHAEYTIKIAEAGKPVYVEKPMAVSHKQCMNMINACKRNNVKLFVAYYRRCLSLFVRVKKLIEEGTIGDIQFVNINLFIPPGEEDYQKENLPWRLKKEIAGGGYFVDLASHQFDFLNYVFGQIKKIANRTKNLGGLYKVEDYVSALFEFENGIEGSGIWSFCVNKNLEKDQVEVIGSKGSITFSTFEQNPIRVITPLQKFEITEPFPDHVQQPLIQTVVDELTGNGKCPSTGVTAARTNWLIDQILNKT
ncbi:MAG: Gfo/Idh/MocA family oxidoreductase [Ignavibacteria bacterium]|jgi:predicted dehydrogenase